MATPPIDQRHLPHFHKKEPVKEACRAATTANITISTALNNGDSLDGVTLATGDRVLVKNQSTGSQNGIYIVDASPFRAYDCSTDDPQIDGCLIPIEAGTTNASTVWQCTNTATPTIGSTSLTFTKIAPISGLTDPMTTRGDIIVRNASNVTARLGIGASGKILSSDGTDVSWGNGPMTTQDDIIVGGASGIPTRLAKGSDSQVLTVDPTTHHLVWATASSGFSDPMTTRGDIIIRNASNTTARLGRGSANTVLQSDGTDVSYTSVLPAHLDVSADNTTANATTGHHGLLPKGDGSASHFLDGTLAWSTPAGGGSGGTSGTIARSTVGTTGAGASYKAPSSHTTYLKTFTTTTDGWLIGINAYVKGNGDPSGLGCAILDDSSGAPQNIIAAGRPTGSDSSGGVSTNNVQLNSTARWIHMPIGAWLVAGTYWLAVELSPGATGANSIQLAYTASTGADKTQAHGLRQIDVSIVGTSNTTDDHSIYADMLTPTGGSAVTSNLVQYSQHITADVTLTTANTTYDSGLTYTPAVGTWLLLATVNTRAGAAACTHTVKLWDGTTAYDSSEITLAAASYNAKHTLAAIVTQTGSTAYKVSVTSNANGGTIAATPANNNTGLTNTNTELIAIKLDGIAASGPGAGFVGARATNTAGTTINNNTETAVPFASEDYDTTGFHDNSTNNTRHTIPTGQSGKYRLTGQVRFSSSQAFTQGYIYFLKNGTDVIGLQWQALVTGTQGYQATWEGSLSAGDYVEMYVLQISGGNRTLNTTAGYNWFTISRLDGGVPISGAPIGLTSYRPGTDTTIGSTSNTTATDVDSTNLSVTFTVPPSGKVLVRFTGVLEIAAANSTAHWVLRESTTSLADNIVGFSTPQSDSAVSTSFLITGLTPGSSKTYKWAHYRNAGSSTVVVIGGPTFGEAVIEVWDAGTPAAIVGASFPSSPVTNQKFFRTDLGLDCYYDGTQWLTATLFETSEHLASANATSPLTLYVMPVDATWGIYLVDFNVSTYVATTNDSSKYWTLALVRSDTTNTPTTIVTASTQGDTVANWVREKQAINAVLNSTARVLQVDMTKVSTPGNLYASCSIKYRYVIT